MIVSWKVLRTSIAMSACLGLLAACQDRGQFHSKKWTNAELAKNFAAAQAKQNKTADSQSPDGAPVAPAPTNTSVTGKPDKGFSGNDPADSKPDPAKPAAPTVDNGGSSKGNLLLETLQSRDSFIADNNKMMAALDPLAANTYKGVTAVVLNPNGVFTIGIDAAIQIGNDLRYVTVAPSSISPTETDGKPISLTFKAKDGLNEDSREVTLKDGQLSILAVCSDLKCSEVHVRMTLDADGKGKITLAMVLAPDVDAKGRNVYAVKNSNLKDQLKDFETFKNSGRPDKDKKPDDVPTTVTGESGGAKGPDGKGGESQVTQRGDQEKSAGDQAALKEANEQTAKALSDDNAAAAKMAQQAQGSQVLKEANEQTAKALSDDNAAAAKMAQQQSQGNQNSQEEANAQAAKAASDAAKAFVSSQQQPAQPSAQNRGAFVNSQQSVPVPEVSSSPVVEAKTQARPLQMTQDPGTFKLDQPATPPPGIFGAAKGLTNAAVENKPATNGDPKVDEATNLKNQQDYENLQNQYDHQF